MNDTTLTPASPVTAPPKPGRMLQVNEVRAALHLSKSPMIKVAFEQAVDAAAVLVKGVAAGHRRW